LVAKLAIHPGEDLAKTGYKPDMKTKTLIILLHLLLATKCFKPHIKFLEFCIISFPSLLVIENIQHHFVFKFSNFK
jgi:hypothetical protein